MRRNEDTERAGHDAVAAGGRFHIPDGSSVILRVPMLLVGVAEDGYLQSRGFLSGRFRDEVLLCLLLLRMPGTLDMHSHDFRCAR
jgi:hypothetical protein